MNFDHSKIEALQSGNAYLDNLIEQFLQEFSDRISNCRTIGDKILLGLHVGSKNNRQQTITIGIIKVPDDPFLLNSDNSSVLFLSRIGKIKSNEDLSEILRYAFGIHYSGVVMEDDQTVCLKHTIDEIEEISLAKFSIAVLEMAHHADVLEEILLEQDVN